MACRLSGLMRLPRISRAFRVTGKTGIFRLAENHLTSEARGHSHACYDHNRYPRVNAVRRQAIRNPAVRPGADGGSSLGEGIQDLMPKESGGWMEAVTTQKQSIYPAEWWNGRIWTITRGELPWWPLGRPMKALQTGIRRAGETKGYRITTHKVDDNTLQFMAEQYE